MFSDRNFINASTPGIHCIFDHLKQVHRLLETFVSKDIDS